MFNEKAFGPGSKCAPEQVKKAYTGPAKEGYLFLKPARSIYWQRDEMNYWIQWTRKDDVTVLWAFDPEANQTVEVLQVRQK